MPSQREAAKGQKASQIAEWHRGTFKRCFQKDQ